MIYRIDITSGKEQKRLLGGKSIHGNMHHNWTEFSLKFDGFDLICLHLSLKYMNVFKGAVSKSN